MRSLFDDWPEVAERLRSAGTVLLFTDFDGTLAPICERPELACLPAETRRSVKRLAALKDVQIAIVSGRALADIKELVGLDGVIYAGNHGLEIEGPGLDFVHAAARQLVPLVRAIRLALEKALSTTRGALVEDKTLTLSVHYRQVPEEHSKSVKAAFQSIVGPSRDVGKVRVTHGKKVLEVRPAVEWDKGKALELVLDRFSKWHKAPVVPIYLGDDVTDEDGFRSAEKHGGITIFVGDPGIRSSARYCLSDPGEVQRFLEMLIEARTLDD